MISDPIKLAEVQKRCIGEHGLIYVKSPIWKAFDEFICNSYPELKDYMPHILFAQCPRSLRIIYMLSSCPDPHDDHVIFSKYWLVFRGRLSEFFGREVYVLEEWDWSIPCTPSKLSIENRITSASLN